MLLENIHLQGLSILEVKEEADGQIIDILLDLPSEEQGDLDKKILRLKEVVSYTRKEVPSAGIPVIRNLKILHSPRHTTSVFADATAANYKIEIITNAGRRVLEFADWSWHEAAIGKIHSSRLQENILQKVGIGFY